MSGERSRIVSIASGKGGVGKTTASVNLAAALGRQGKRVLILDADFGLSNVDILLGVHPDKTLEDVLFDGLPMEQAILPVGERLDILSGSSGVSRMAELTRKERSRLISEFQKLERYDYILIDNSPGLSAQVISMCLSSREVVITATPEAASLTDAYALIKVLRENGLWWSPLVLVNRAQDRQQAQWAFERLQSTARDFLKLNCLFLGYVLEDKRVASAARSRRPVLEDPSSPAAACFMESARRLMRRSERKGQDISPERFWDNSVMLFQQRPRFDAPPGGRAPLRPHPALPQGLARLLALLDASVSELHECGNPADLAGKLGPVREALAGLQAGVRAPGVPVPDAGCAGAGEAVEVRRISLLCPEPEMRELLRDVTEELGFEVVAMEPSGPPAKGARLVLISWDSPDSTPQDALRKCAGIPAVVMQGYLQQADWPDLDHDAALAVLKKPFRIDELNEVVLRLADVAGTAGRPAQADCPA